MLDIHQRPVCHRRKIHPPHPLGKVSRPFHGELSGHGLREARLAHAAGFRNSHEDVRPTSALMASTSAPRP